jgi:hypothetical protein
MLACISLTDSHWYASIQSNISYSITATCLMPPFRRTEASMAGLAQGWHQGLPLLTEKSKPIVLACSFRLNFD